MMARVANAPHRSNYAKNPYPRIRVGGKQVYVHRFVYEAAYGSIPQGYVVHHIDGDYRNNNLWNLIALSKTDHAKLHNELEAGS